MFPLLSMTEIPVYLAPGSTPAAMIDPGWITTGSIFCGMDKFTGFLDALVLVGVAGAAAGTLVNGIEQRGQTTRTVAEEGMLPPHHSHVVSWFRGSILAVID